MAHVKSKKTAVRRTHNRRKLKIQRLDRTEIQVAEAIADNLRTSLDLDWYTGTKWLDGLVRTVVRPGLREVIGKIHNALQTGILHPKPAERVRMDPPAGRFPKDRKSDKSSRPTVVRGRVSANARARLPDGFGVTPTYCDEDVSGHGERVYQYDARQPIVRSGKRSGRKRKVQTDSERRALPGGHHMGNCPQCVD